MTNSTPKTKFQFFQAPNIQNGSRASSDTIPFHISSSFNLLRLITGEKHHIPLSLPHTITYRSHDAPAWYFTSQKKSHTVFRKNSANVTMDGIYEQFKKSLLTRKQRMYQMSHEQARNNMKEIKEAKMENAKFNQSLGGSSSGALSSRNRDDLLLEEDSDRKIRGVMISQRGIAHERLKAEVEFFNKAKLKKFLFDKRKKRITDGFLQQFVPPSGDYNTHIKVTWTPSMCLIENKRNKYRMDDDTVDLHTRYSVLNNDESWSMAEQLDSSIVAQIERLNAGIVQQIFRITDQVHSVRKMVLTLKVDALGKLWFLFFDALRTSTEDYPHPAKWINFILYNATNDDDVSPESKPKNTTIHKDHTMSVLQNHAEDRPTTSKSVGARSSRSHASQRATSAHTIATHAKTNPPHTSPTKAQNVDAQNTKLAHQSHKHKGHATSSKRRGSALAVECPSCAIRFDRQSGMDVSYRVIIQHYHIHNEPEQDASGRDQQITPRTARSDTGGLSPMHTIKDDSVFEPLSGEGPVGEVYEDGAPEPEQEVPIPPILQKLEPALGPLRYEKLRFNPIWTSKLVKMCDSCASTYFQDVIDESSLTLPHEVGAQKKHTKISTLRLKQLSRPDSSKNAQKKRQQGRKSATPTEKFRRHVMQPVQQYAKRSRSPYEVHQLRSKTQDAIVQKILRAGKKNGSKKVATTHEGVTPRDLYQDDTSSGGLDTARSELLRSLPVSRRTSTNLGSARRELTGQGSTRPRSTPVGVRQKAPPRNSAARRSFAQALEHYGGGGPPSRPSTTFQRPFIPSRSSPLPRSTKASTSLGYSATPLIQSAIPVDPKGDPVQILKDLQKERQDLLDSLRHDLHTIDVPEDEIDSTEPTIGSPVIDTVVSSPSAGGSRANDDRMSPASPQRAARMSNTTSTQQPEQESIVTSEMHEQNDSSSPDIQAAAAKRSATPVVEGGQSEASFDEAIFEDDDFMDDEINI
eukprot:CAMPEP_0117449372 /NCGR_PEP_ID=MMETSP0759-20121206/7911_1 /TAXON_ID=63605 /ORGANISM="Percolomonas cosmopolitus, Strain WS" /LENGTH=972 /DNA_ID=CAMNT_0005241845 /DNA_START=245 /DNA_END=3164 /DNA_ORIENTATION=+